MAQSLKIRKTQFLLNLLWLLMYEGVTPVLGTQPLTCARAAHAQDTVVFLCRAVLKVSSPVT